MQENVEQEFAADVLKLLSIELPKLLKEVKGAFKVIIHISPDHQEARIEPPPKSQVVRRTK